MNDSKANDIIKIYKVRELIFSSLTDKQTPYSKLETVDACIVNSISLSNLILKQKMLKFNNLKVAIHSFITITMNSSIPTIADKVSHTHQSSS